MQAQMLEIHDDPFGLKPISVLDDDKMQEVADYISSPTSALGFSHDCTSGSSDASQNQMLAVSTTFWPDAVLSSDLSGVPSDLVIQSSDSVFFYCHASFIRSKSYNNFNQLIPSSSSHSAPSSPLIFPSSTSDLSLSDRAANSYIKTPYLSDGEDTPPMSPASSRSDQSRSSSDASIELPSTSSATLPILVAVPESSAVVNIALHLLYGLNFEPYSPQLDTLSQVFPFLAKCGFSQQELVPAGSQLCSAILSFAPKYPLEVYALAAQNRLHDLAVMASQYTLAISLSSLSDQQSMDMGPLYLKWLFFLHLGRAEALKRILVTPFDPHAAGLGTCDAEDQKALARAWGLVTAYVLSTSSMQSVSIGMLKSTYGPLVSSVRCAKCKQVLEDQIHKVVQNWSLVKCTI